MFHIRFEYVKKGREYIVSEVSDEEGWRKIRNTLAMGHVFDGRKLELNYACETIKYLFDFWGGRVMLITCLEEVKKAIICDENRKVSVHDL